MDFVEQVKSSVDIVKVIGEHVRLKKLGATGRYVGLCPFHQEKTPSFSVHGVHQFYRCFGCNVGGDVFKFVMEMERVTFFEALKMLAERNGIPMPRRAEYSDPETKLRGALFDIHEIAAELFRKNLFGNAGAEARAYLAKRGVTPGQAEEFRLGLSLDSWDQLTKRLQQESFATEQLEQSGLVMKRSEGSGHYDRFRARLIFPIHNEAGKVTGFGGRALKPGDEPKYLNSPETPIYRKSYLLYNLHRAKEAIRKLDRVILVEGYMDVIGVYSAGVREVVASCGTSLTNSQVRVLKKHSEKIVVNFDPDAAGARASERSIQMLLDEGMQVKVLALDGNLDPDEYVKTHGAEAYHEKLKQAPGYFHWLSDQARRNFDMRSAEGRVAGLQFLLPSIQRVTNRLERATIAEEVASYLGIDRGLVLDEFRRTAADKPAAPRKQRAAEIPAVEKLLLNALLSSSEARSEVLPRLLELTTFAQLVSKGILQEIALQHASGGGFSFSGLEARLNDRDRDLLTGVVFADEMGEGEQGLQQALECLRALASQEREIRLTAVRDQIKAAERNGNLEEAIRLIEELNRLAVKRRR